MAATPNPNAPADSPRLADGLDAGGAALLFGALGRLPIGWASELGGSVTMLADQKLNEGIPVPLFGRPVMTTTALALLALRFDCDVLPARVERLHGARFRLMVFPPLPLPPTKDHRGDMAELTAAVAAVLVSWIRERAEEWLWVHRRWPD
jgi:Kdo2-lipid IVA lauroyltransferase/acyltransferase